MKEKYEYDPDKLFPIDVRSKKEHYLAQDPIITINTGNNNLSTNKRARKELGILETKGAKTRFLCDGFKIYVDSMVGENDKNCLNISNSNVASSRSLCEELKKHYNIEAGARGVFNMVKVEKYRFRLELKKQEPVKIKK
jgi:hypothetical protein